MNDYQAKFVTPEQAVKAVQSGDWVDYGFGGGFLEAILLELALIIADVPAVIAETLLLGVCFDDSMRGRITRPPRTLTSFTSPMRAARALSKSSGKPAPKP